MKKVPIVTCLIFLLPLASKALEVESGPMQIRHSTELSPIIKLSGPNDTIKRTDIRIIYRLKKMAKDSTYGFSPENPVKVGSGPHGGAGNQRRYLSLLRDAKGASVKYKRLRSCCSYPSENGLSGIAMVDEYEIIYLNDLGRKEKALVYISYYDYEDPQILYGFKTVEK